MNHRSGSWYALVIIDHWRQTVSMRDLSWAENRAAFDGDDYPPESYREPDPCWDCIKGRHLICAGEPCNCPVPHDGNRRKPGCDGNRYFDAGEDAQLADE